VLDETFGSRETSVSHPLMPAPMILPMPKVIAAAARPKSTCLVPETSALRPVMIVIPAPMTKSAITLRTTLTATAQVPPPKY
jgi:hypothetical protein